MQCFKDVEGKTWTIKATVATMNRVRDQVGVDLMDLTAEGQTALSRVLDDPNTLCKVLLAMSDNPDRIEFEQFIELIDGNVLSEGRRVFIEEVPNFFFDQGLKELSQIQMKKTKEFMDETGKAVLLIVDKLEKMTVEEALTLSESASGSSPESSE